MGCLGCLGRGLGYGVGAVLALAGLGLYLLALPDLPPIDPAAFSVAAVQQRFQPDPDLSSLPKHDPNLDRFLAQRAKVPPAGGETRTVTLSGQIRSATTIPLRGTVILHPAGGDQLVLVLNAEKIATGAIPGSGAAASGYVALINLAEAKQVNLSGFKSYSAVVQDDRGRELYHVAVLSGALEAYRAGQIDRRTYITKMAFEEVSTIAVFDLLRRQFGK